MKRSITLVILGMLLLLVGCGSDRGSVPPGPTTTGQHVAAIVSSIGLASIYIGTVATAIGGIALLASTFIAFLAPFRKLIGDLTAVGTCGLLVGTCILYVGEHPWIVPASIAAILVGLIVRFHGTFAQWFANPTVAKVVAVVETDAEWVYDKVRGLFVHPSTGTTAPVPSTPPVATPVAAPAGSVPVPTIKS